MPPEADRPALLARIIAEGDRRRRRRLALSGTGAAVAVAVVATGLALTVAGLGDDGEERVDVANETDASSTTTTAPDDRTTTTNTVPAFPETTTTLVPADDTTPATTTEPPPVCRNSHDERCGDFSWDYDPDTFPNAPLAVTTTYEPEVVVVGEPVTFTVTASDADGATFVGCNWIQTFPNIAERTFDWRGECSDPPPPCPGPDVPRYGPWDVPEPEPDAGPTTHTATVVFTQPGTYLVVTHVVSGDACIGDAPPGDAYRFYGYTESKETELTVEVVAAG